jgi:hypothetical protein
LLSIPGASEWTLIITKDLNVTSPGAYKKENDVVRVKAPVMALPMHVETFTATFANVTNNSFDLHLFWEKTLVAMTVTTDVDSKVMKQIDDAMNKDSRPYYPAAQYYYDNGKDLKQA